MNARITVRVTGSRSGKQTAALAAFRAALVEANEIESSPFLTSVLKYTIKALPTAGQLKRANKELAARGLTPVVCPVRVDPMNAKRQALEQERREHAAAFDVMCAARPLSPPPLRDQPRTFPASLLALKRDQKLGVA